LASSATGFPKRLRMRSRGRRSRVPSVATRSVIALFWSRSVSRKRSSGKEQEGLLMEARRLF